jgi:protein-tyrosine phosphatase
VWLALAGCASQAGLTPQAAAPSKSAVAAPAPAHQRLLPLEGGQNFRDLGGYTGAGGKQVKWGLLLRSGAMNGLTAHDYSYLEDTVGLRTVIDLRSTQERKYAAVNWPAAHAPTVLAEDYAMDASAITRVMSKGKVTPDVLIGKRRSSSPTNTVACSKTCWPARRHWPSTVRLAKIALASQRRCS